MEVDREEPISWGQGGILREVTGEKRTVADWPLDEVKCSKRHPRQFQMVLVASDAKSSERNDAKVLAKKCQPLNKEA